MKIVLYEINSIYCSRCKKFAPIFDAVNLNFSATEIICANCGQILLLMKSKMQSRPENDFSYKKIESYVRRENRKTAENLRINRVILGTNTA